MNRKELAIENFMKIQWVSGADNVNIISLPIFNATNALIASDHFEDPPYDPAIDNEKYR